MATTAKKSVAKKKAQRRQKLTDSDRHARFMETAREIGASDTLTDFENAFNKIVSREKSKTGQRT